MPEILNLSAEPRTTAGKGAARAARRAGRVPAVVYGDHKEPVLVSLEPRELARAAARPGFFATLVELKVDGESYRTLPREVQYHPITDTPMHVDFMRVGAGAQVNVTVPVAFINQDKAPGLRRGGILNIVRHGIEVVCSVDNIPDRLVVDVDGLDIGDSIHIGAVTLPEGARPVIHERDFTIATIAAPAGLGAQAEAEQAAVSSAAKAESDAAKQG